jgi:hypothetical protein
MRIEGDGVGGVNRMGEGGPGSVAAGSGVEGHEKLIVLKKMTNRTKIAAWIAGGASGAACTANLIQLSWRAPAHGRCAGIWALTISGTLFTCLLVLALVLDHLDKRPYRNLLDMAARNPERADAYTKLIDADARHESVKNGATLTDHQHGWLYRPGDPKRAAETFRRRRGARRARTEVETWPRRPS